MTIKQYPLDGLVSNLLNQSLIINELKDHAQMIEIEEYLNLLDGFLNLARSHRDYINNIQKIFSEVDSLQGR